MADTKARNYCLDYIKGIACILVVFMHCEFPGYLGTLVQTFSRFCVPFFFMVSGYFCYRAGGGYTDYRKKIRHVAGITLGAVVFYLIITPLYSSGSISITADSLVKWLVFNVPPYVAGQLWFLFALLYDYILFALVEKFSIRKLAYIAIPVGIAAYILCAQGARLMGISVPNMFYRNFLIEGFPLFALGFWIHEHQDKIHVSNKVLLLTLVISTLLCPVERLLMGRDFGVNIVSFPQVASLFLLGVNNPGFGAGRPLNRLGAKYSMYVYIIHPAVWHVLDKLYSFLHVNESIAALYARPVLCVAITIMCSIIFLNGKKLIMEKVTSRKV